MNRWLYVSVTLVGAALAAVGYVWFFRYDDLPGQVPVHWDVNFHPDGFVPREGAWKMFLLVPAMMAGWVLLTLLLPWLSPKRFDVDRFRNTYYYVMALVQGLFCFINVALLLGALGAGPALGKLFVGGIFLFFALLGNVLGKVKRNFWVGVRTPWTLASEAVWDRTHRVAAWLFVAAGLVGFVAVLAGVPFWLCFAGLLAAVFAPVLYSLWLYKRLQREGRLDGGAGEAAPT
ncbi:MAG TPA: SdpI family protein, partial [Gemmataceae bacterium]|nr:SdpI family protein [Gemmataceae bacterium]